MVSMATKMMWHSTYIIVDQDTNITKIRVVTLTKLHSKVALFRNVFSKNSHFMWFHLNTPSTSVGSPLSETTYSQRMVWIVNIHFREPLLLISNANSSLLLLCLAIAYIWKSTFGKAWLQTPEDSISNNHELVVPHVNSCIIVLSLHTRSVMKYFYKIMFIWKCCLHHWF